MQIRFLAVLFMFTFSFAAVSFAQELFPTTEPASCIPKGAFAVQPIAEIYKEYSILRWQFALRFYYGITSRWEIYAEPVENNHHSLFLPENFLTHTHPTATTTSYSASSVFGLKYPFLYAGVYAYTKFRLFSFDQDNSHFRIAAYGEYSSSTRAHDEAEPDLVGDNGGWGAGLIFTKLKNRLALSLTSGVVIANDYSENVKYPYYGNYIFSNAIQYGKELKLDLSIGYLLYPSHYESYFQDNYNIYLELKGTSYSGATVSVGGVQAAIQTPSLGAGQYLEVWPGIQGIYNSNTRISLSAGFNAINRSWNHFTPVYVISVFRYFYFKKKKSLLF